MEDSLKGILITLTLITLFTSGILGYIVLFPQEQGYTFNNMQGGNTYLQIANMTDLNITSQLVTLNNQSQSAFNSWDITQGFMGSNSVKQQSQSGISSYNSNFFSVLLIIGKSLFGSGSPIVYAITVIFLLSTGVIVYQVIKFVRQGE